MSSLLAQLRDRMRDDRGSVTVWVIGATVGSMLLIGLVLDGGTMLRARSDAFSIASAAARAGAQQLDADAAVDGQIVVDPGAANAAALDYLAAHGVTGHVAVTTESVTVTVTTTANLQLLGIVGAGPASFTASATVDVIKVTPR